MEPDQIEVVDVLKMGTLHSIFLVDEFWPESGILNGRMLQLAHATIWLMKVVWIYLNLSKKILVLLGSRNFVFRDWRGGLTRGIFWK